MREIYKTYSQKEKRQMKPTTISVALLVVATLVFSSSIPAMAIQTYTTKLNKDIEVEIPEIADMTALDPTLIQEAPALNQRQTYNNPILGGFADDGYCYNAIGTQGPGIFPDYDPTAWELLAPSPSTYFIAGGTWSCEEIWYGVQYNNGLLWTINPEDGDMVEIGGGGSGLNGAGWDPKYNRLYGASSTHLYEINPTDGEQTEIGEFDGFGATKAMICIVFDLEGNCYGWDVKFSGNAILYSINIETGEATEINECNMNLLYAQDGFIDWDTGICYLTGYNPSMGPFFATMDLETAEIEHIDDFPSGTEMTCAMAMSDCIPPEHDVGINKIISPQTGYATANMEMKIEVENKGNNTETFDAQMEIIKCEAGALIYEEYFDAGTLPEGWETDWWTIYPSSNAGGESPEARVYYYDQYRIGRDYYDNYINTSYIDCTGLEKVNLRFRWASQLATPRYCSAYVKFRRNATSPWKNVSPWENPLLGGSQEEKLYEIGCYGFEDPLTEEFQVKWEYIGYYSYFRYFWLDDVTLEACGGCAEYAELQEDITLEKDEVIEISFPPWRPSEWQNETSENTWEEYPLHAFIILEGDQRPRNDEKWVYIDLYYPWMHDIELNRIDSPSERSMPAQTFPVEATMKNIGQYAECCIPIELSIGEPVPEGALLSEQFTTMPYYGPPYGWTDEAKRISYYAGWRRSYSNYAGGTAPEAYMYYYYAYNDHVLYSPLIDASSYDLLMLNFLSEIRVYSAGCVLQAGYSYDAETWFAAWSVEPTSNADYEVSVPIKGGAPIYIGFWAKSAAGTFYWYLDNVELQAISITEEYIDFACQGPDIEPGQEVTFTFDDWTPSYLAEETSGSKDYIVQASIEMENDKNPGNDVLVETLTLDYWHDVGIDEITSPAGPIVYDAPLYDNGDPDGVNGLAGSYYYGYRNMIVDDFTNEKPWTMTGAQVNFLWNVDYGINTQFVEIWLFKDDGSCKPEMTETAILRATSWYEYRTGESYFSRPESVVVASIDPYELDPGHWWIAVVLDGLTENIAYVLTTEEKGCGPIWCELLYWGYQRWTSSSTAFGTDYDVCYKVLGTSQAAPPINAYVAPGTEDIDIVVKNYGTFPKMDLICSAEIKEWVTDPNGTSVYTDEISNIDLPTPLGGTRALQFADYTFPEEGRYGLFLDFPADPDDIQRNNNVIFGIGCDDTAPVSEEPPWLIPAAPNGRGKWYISDIIVRLNASDPESGEVSSGVREIRYTINDGTEQVLPGDTGEFTLTEDGEDIVVKYWAVDNVGNVEATKHQFTVSIDQTPPEVALSYEVTGWSMGGYEFTFTATATDLMSQMWKVEFYLNDMTEVQHEVVGDGPEYVWVVTYFPLPGMATFRALAFDEAGLTDYDDVINPKTSSHSVPRTQQNNDIPNTKPLPR